MTIEVAVDPARPGADKTVLVVIGGGHFVPPIGWLGAFNWSRIVFLDPSMERDETDLERLASMPLYPCPKLIEPMPKAAAQLPIWSADYRNKRGRR